LIVRVVAAPHFLQV